MTAPSPTTSRDTLFVQSSLLKLRGYIERESFRGYDPYDGLNSFIPFQKFGKWPAILAMQAIKRSPVNIRPLIGVAKSHNPKAMGLLLHAYSLLFEIDKSQDTRETADFLFQWVRDHHSKGYSGYAWGYNFDWAGSAKTVKAYTPTAVATGFVARGLRQYYHITGNQQAKEMLVSAARFILDDLHHADSPTGHCISYTPLVMDHCYNASLLGAEVLAGAFSLTGEDRYRDTALKCVDYVIHRQKPSGKWNYSLNPSSGVEREQIDFHQGYVMESIDEIRQLLGLPAGQFADALRNGLSFYFREQFFSEGRSKWRLPVEWPVEIHNQAQGIIVFSRMASFNSEFLPFAATIARWTIENMQDPTGYFYFRKYPAFTNKISYMRWSQTWMLLALTQFLHAHREGLAAPKTSSSNLS